MEDIIRIIIESILLIVIILALIIIILCGCAYISEKHEDLFLRLMLFMSYIAAFLVVGALVYVVSIRLGRLI